MIIRSTPENLDDFVEVDGKQGAFLQMHDFQPMYMNFKSLYFKKTEALLNFIQNEKKKGGEMFG